MTPFENFVVTTIIAGLVGVLFGLWRDKRFAEFKNDIEQRAFEHRTRFSSLHEKRAEIIAQLYQKISSTLQKIELASSPLPIPKEEDTRYDRAWTAYLEFNEYFEANRIYFTRKQCEMLDGLSKLMGRSSLGTKSFEKDQLSEESMVQLAAFLQETRDGIPALQESLEDTFREILGIELEENRELTPAQ